MGQQVPFETISGIAHSILKQAGAGATPIVGRIQLEDQITARAEINFSDKGKQHEVHIYEAYWAPLTEGKVTLRAVLLFLSAAGARGIGACLKGFKFQRWKFGGLQECRIRAGTLPQLILVLLLVGAIVLLYGSLVTSTPNWIAQSIGLKPVSGDISGHLRALLYSPFSLWPILFLVILLMRLLKHRLISKAKTGWVLPAWTGVGIFALLTLLGGLLSAHAFLAHAFNASTLTWKWEEQLAATKVLNAWSGTWLVSFLWVGAAAVFLLLRFFLVEFVGDVTIYVSSYKVSVFDEVRKAIQQAGRDMANLIYGAGVKTKGVAYDRVIFVGHSLGSVLAYDTLNDMIVRDSLDPRLGVTQRTTALVTFGSPLDKTAFLFRAQVFDDNGQPDQIREALAASVQPLISEAAMRPSPACGFQWTNIYSKADIISGSLDYYDDLNHTVPSVRNIVDPDANIPLAAHVQYWGNQALAQVLHQEIVR